jgi:NAD(P)-dependent dehydrogenase (short-subunit alcohol dehydrogenase family)
MDLELKGKTAIVTGGSRGIGKAIAREFGREGVDVALVSRGREALEETAAELGRETGAKYVVITADTSDDGSVRDMVQEAARELGHLDILVNGAAKVGGGPAPRLGEITEEAFWDDMNTKVLGYLRCAREVAPYMASRGWGRIINLSGMAARQSGTIIGSMRNVSVAALTKNLADELGPLGINVSVVHPGLTRTERTAAMVEAQMQSQGISAAEAEKNMASNISIGRMVDAEEIAYVVTFLASPKSVAITGDAIATSGGNGRAIHY